MCYRDMTFCPYNDDCHSGKDCPRALTDEVWKQAEMWWGSKDAPIAIFTEKPWCFEAKQPT